ARQRLWRYFSIVSVDTSGRPEMIHQPKLVVGECVPRVLDRHRTGGIAAIGVALVHGDAAEVVLELFHRIENGGLPVSDARIQSAAGGDQQREAGADLLIANANVAPLTERHGHLPRLRKPVYSISASHREHPKPAKSPMQFAFEQVRGVRRTRSGA